MYIFGIVAAAVALGFYEYVVKPNLPSAQVGGPAAATGPAFTAGGKIKVGDVVTVSMVSLEPNPLENRIPTKDDPQSIFDNAPVPTQAESAILNSLDNAAQSGGTIDLLVTATGLSANDSGNAVPVSIGILQAPGITTRLAAVFLNASVQRITRNGQVVP
jgi:hypothetical protein